jgi:hypothetical protein
MLFSMMKPSSSGIKTINVNSLLKSDESTLT